MTWVFLTRADSARDLVDELGPRAEAREVAEGVVRCAQRPRRPDGHLADPAFARQALKKVGEGGPDVEAVAARLAREMARHQPKAAEAEAWTWALQVVAPDSADPVDPRKKVAAALEAELPAALDAHLSEEVRARARPDEAAARLVQAWVVREDRVTFGLTPANQALSRVPGGRTKYKRPADAVSRSGLKLEEAMDWAGVGPGKGDLAADLGSAPGGWTQVAVRHGATVIAVDPARMKVELPKKRFAHAKMSAFDYVPAETLDWVICDMAWRPLEVAQLLAKWARRVWARQMIANFKLPMTEKAKILKDILRILGKAGWQGLRARQLFHDRDEVTVFGYLEPGRAHLGAQPAFEWRSSGGKKPRGAPRGPRGRGGPRGRKGQRAEPRRGGGRGDNRGPRGSGRRR